MLNIEGIEKFRIADDSLHAFKFNRLLEGVDPTNRKASYDNAKSAYPGNEAKSGIYFWVMRWNESDYAIYIGKSIDIVGRLSNYTGKFQPFSPNNFKIVYFHKFMLREFPGASLNFYYRAYALDKKALHDPENIMIKNFKEPLINRLESSYDSKDAIQTAFRQLYDAGFESALSR